MTAPDRFFKLTENKTSIRTEIIAGVTTFATMSYIIVVQPATLETCGMDFGAVMVATCIASAFATLVMGLWANYPIALAPAMGHNHFFAVTVCGAMGYAWNEALGAVLVAGIVFLALSVLRVREKIIAAVPVSLRFAIGAGIGLFIALIGLQTAGLAMASPGPGQIITLAGWEEPTTLIAALSLLVTSALMARRVPGAILIGMAIAAGLCLATKLIRAPASLVSLPPSLEPTLGKLTIPSILEQPGFLVVVVTFLYLDLFDTLGTLIGVGERAGFMKDGKLPRAEKALVSDASGTVVGAALGTSTVTSYIESCAGVASGGRTGLASVTTAALFLLALPFTPVITAVGGGIELLDGRIVNPITGPALIVVGCMMMAAVKRIEWDDYAEAIPAFLTMVVMTVDMNISAGISAGFVTYVLLKFAQGKAGDVPWLTHVCGLLGILYFVFLHHGSPA